MVAGKRHIETVTTDGESCSSPDQPKSRFNFEILKMTQKAISRAYLLELAYQKM